MAVGGMSVDRPAARNGQRPLPLEVDWGTRPNASGRQADWSALKPVVQGARVRSIAKLLSCSRNTVRRYLRHEVHARIGTKAIFQFHAIGPQTKGASRAGRKPENEGNFEPTGGDWK
jgi:hypothetical protein